MTKNTGTLSEKMDRQICLFHPAVVLAKPLHSRIVAGQGRVESMETDNLSNELGRRLTCLWWTVF